MTSGSLVSTGALGDCPDAGPVQVAQGEDEDERQGNDTTARCHVPPPPPSSPLIRRRVRCDPFGVTGRTVAGRVKAVYVRCRRRCPPLPASSGPSTPRTPRISCTRGRVSPLFPVVVGRGSSSDSRRGPLPRGTGLVSEVGEDDRALMAAGRLWRCASHQPRWRRRPRGRRLRSPATENRFAGPSQSAEDLRLTPRNAPPIIRPPRCRREEGGPCLESGRVGGPRRETPE